MILKNINYNYIYKVYFKGLLKANFDDFKLTFYHNNEDYILDDFPSFLLHLNDLSRKKKSHNFCNIKEIISLKENSKINISQYFVFLYSIKNDEKVMKKGLFIGKCDDNNYRILGIWPIENNPKISLINENYNQLLIDIKKKSAKYKDILLIS